MPTLGFQRYTEARVAPNVGDMTEREIPERLRSLPSWLLVEAAARASRLVSELTTKAGVPKAAYPILAVLEAAGPLSQAEVGRRVRIDRKDLSGYAARLEQAGVVTRRPDPADVRRNLLENTPAGSELLERLDPAFAAAQDQLLARLTAAERATLTRLLDVVAGGVTDELRPPGPDASGPHDGVGSEVAGSDRARLPGPASQPTATARPTARPTGSTGPQPDRAADPPSVR